MRALALGNRWWSSTRSSSPVLAQSLVSWVKVHALVDACGGRVPGFHKLVFMFRRSLSHDSSSVPVEGVDGCETVQGEKRILILSSDGAFVFLHTCAELPTGLAHVGAGRFRVWYLAHHVPLLLRWESVLHTCQRAPN